MKATIFLGLAAAAGLSAGTAIAQEDGQGTLQQVQDRGNLSCGVNTGLTGFSEQGPDGTWTGFDVAYCRALAAAIFDDPQAVEFVPLTPKTRFTALDSGEIDVLSRNTTWTFTRDADLGFTFIGTTYYDGQGFMVPSELGVSSATELDGATVCIQTGTTTELNLADYFRVNNMEYEPVPVQDASQARQQYLAGACDVYTTDRSGLAATRASLENPKDHVILPETISKEPLGPVVRQGEDAWADIARWVRNALVIAEENGVTSANVAQLAEEGTDNPETNRMLGVEGNYGEILGLGNEWAVNAIEANGNYGEIFAKFIGQDTPIGLSRGLNALWTNGGILYAPPFR